MTAALEGGEGSAARPSRTLPSGKTRYPLYIIIIIIIIIIITTITIIITTTTTTTTTIIIICKNKSDTSNNRGKWNQLKIIQKIPEQHTQKVKHNRATQNSYNGHGTRTSESTMEKKH